MKPLKQAFFLLVLLATGCSAIYDVSHDYDQEVDLTQLKSYDWLPVREGVEEDDYIVGRVKRAVKAEMEQKGIRAASDAPDFLIDRYLLRCEKVGYTGDRALSGLGSTIAVIPRNRAVGSYTWVEGTLVLVFFDPESRQLIWRGRARGLDYSRSDPKKDDKLVSEAVHKILQDFPPR